MSPPTRWWWIRHGPIPGAANRLFGQLDVSCDVGDARSFQTLAELLPSGAVWIVSPLKRTRETFDAIVNAGGPVSAPRVEAAFAEQSFGQWQGLGWDQMQAADPLGYAAFWRDPTRNAPPGGESFAALIGRVGVAVERLTAEHAGRDIVAVAHGGPIRAAVAVALDLAPETAMAIVIDTLSVTRLSHVRDGLLKAHGEVWRIEGVNMPCRWIRREDLC